MSRYSREYFSDQAPGSLCSAREVLKLAFEVLPHNSVVDVGCGIGAWLAVAKDLGASRVLGIDGDYLDRSQLMIEEFMAADLSAGIEVTGKFDLAISLEVAEHLPVQSAESFVRFITSLAPTVIFSAAIPLQGGVHHVNEQWPNYWAVLFRKHAFHCYDSLRLRIWTNDAIEPWYRQNLLVYSSVLIPAWSNFRVEVPLPLVHPLFMRPEVEIRSIPRLAVSAVRREIRHYRRRRKAIHTSSRKSR